MVDPYIDPQSGILRNKFNISDFRDLQEAEYRSTFAKTISAKESIRNTTTFSLETWQTVHERLFCDIYDWAGEIRTVDMKRMGGGEFSDFSPHALINRASYYTFDRLREDNNLQNIDKDKYAHKLAEYYNDLYHVHPFREGNTRSIQILFSEISRQTGYNIRWDQLSPEQHKEATLEGIRHVNHKPMERAFSEILQPLQKTIELTPEELMCPKLLVFESSNIREGKCYFIDNESKQRVSLNFGESIRNNQDNFKKGEVYRLSTQVTETGSLEWKVGSAKRIGIDID